MKFKIIRIVKYLHCIVFKPGDIVDVIAIEAPDTYYVATPEHAKSVWLRDTFPLYMTPNMWLNSTEARELSPLELLALEA